MKLGNILKRVSTLQQPSKRIKTETIQAVLATIFIDQGFEMAKEFSKSVWELILRKHGKGHIYYSVSRLQDIVQKTVKSTQANFNISPGPISGGQVTLYPQALTP